MPPFLVIAVVVFLVYWLGWWLVAILGVPLALFALWAYSDSWNSQKNILAPERNLQRLKDVPLRKINIEIKSASFHGKSLPKLNVESDRENDLVPNVALVIHGDPLAQILAGRKVWEMRTKNTRKRGAIALVRKGSGHVYGVADIVDSQGPLSGDALANSVGLHGITLTRLSDPQFAKYRYAWVLANVRQLSNPVPYSHTKGAQSFVRLSRETSAAIWAAIPSIGA
jgi:hypothetical protein